LSLQQIAIFAGQTAKPRQKSNAIFLVKVIAKTATPFAEEENQS
jgi:hypothetical protein